MSSRIVSTLLCVLGAALPSLPAGETASWRSALYPAEGWNPEAALLDVDPVIQDFSYAGYRRGEAPIPTVAGPIFDASAAPYGADATGASDSTAAIQAAIDAAGADGGGVVYLPAGTYRLAVPDDAAQALLINRPGVVLRGAGREKTFLLHTRYSGVRKKAVIRVLGSEKARLLADGDVVAPLSADLRHSTRVIPVRSTDGFAVGDLVTIRNDITPEWVDEHREPGWRGHEARLRGIGYRREIVAIDPAAGTLTVDVPVRYALKLRDRARVVRVEGKPLVEVGLEDFSIGNIQHPGDSWGTDDFNKPGTAAQDVSGFTAIVFEQASHSWMRRVASFLPKRNTTTAHLLSNGLHVRQSTHLTIEDCFFQRTQYGGGDGNGYMFALIGAQECLIRRSEARLARHGFAMSLSTTSGNVLLDCLDADTAQALGAGTVYETTGKGSDQHMWFSQANLIDHCTGENSWFEAVYRPFPRSGPPPLHALTSVHSVYWNTRGTGAIKDAIVKSEQYLHGYVIGTRGERSRVELTARNRAATDPVDHVEGEGRGDTLEPGSLYLDQLRRRLAGASRR